MSSLILKVSNSKSGGAGGPTINEEKNASENNDSVVVSAAVDVISPAPDNKTTATPEVAKTSLTSIGAINLVTTTANAPTVSVPPVNNTPSTVTSSSVAISQASAETKAETIPPLQSSIQKTITPSSATVVVTAPAGNASSPLIARPPTATLGASSIVPNSAATTVITAVPPVSVKPPPVTTVTQQLTPKLPQQPCSKLSNNLSIVSTNEQVSLTTANQRTPTTTTVIDGTLRNNLQPPPISFSAAGARPHQLTIPHVNPSKQSSPSPTITLSPIKPQGPSGATLITAIQSGRAQPHPSGTVLVSNNATPTGGAAIVATHRQLHTVTQQPHRQLQQTVVQQQQPSTVTRIAPTLITGHHTPGTHQHVVQHHPPPLRMVHLPAGATSVTGGNPNLTTRIAVSASSGSISTHVPPTTVSLPQNPAPIAIRHALPQAPLARTTPVSNTPGVSPQLPRSPIGRHPHPQLPQTPVNTGGSPTTTLLTTSRSPHSAPPAHLASTSIITHHPQSAGAVVNRTTLPLASVLASANQQRHIQQQLVTQRVVSTVPGGTTNTVVQGLQHPVHHPGLGTHSLSQSPAGTIMVSHHRPGTISMLPAAQAPASGTVTAGGLLVHHPSNGGSGNLSNPPQGQQTISAGSGGHRHQLVSFPSHPGPPQASSHQRITLPTSNMLAHLSGVQHHGGGLTVSAAVNTPGGIPSAGRQPIAAALAKSSTTILPPTALHHLLTSHPHPQQQQEDDLDVTDTDVSPGHHLHSNSQYQSTIHPQIIGVPRGGAAGVTLNTGRTTITLPSPRGHQQQVQQQPRDRRTLPCQLALQDHNYYSRPPPTPPPPPQSPPILRDVLQEHQRRQQQLHQSFNTSSPFNSVLAAAEVHHQQQQQQLSPGTKQTFVVGGTSMSSGSPSPNTNRTAFSPPLHPHPQSNLRSPVNVVSQHTSLLPHTNSKAAASNIGSIVRLPQYTPDSQKFAAAMVAAVSSHPTASKKQPLLSPTGLVTSFNGPANSNTVSATRPMGKSGLPSRVEAHFRSIQEAGVGPMAPLVDDAPSDSGSASPNIHDMNREDGTKELHDRDDGEETETAPEAEEDDSITRCICDFLHDDGYMICCDKCYVWQHVVCMGLDKNNIPDEYLCEVCKPRPIDRKRAKAMQARRRSELYHHSSSSDEGGGGRQFNNRTKNKGQQKNDRKSSTKGGLTGSKKILDRKVDRINSKDLINRKSINSKMSKKSAAQALAMLNSGTNKQTSFPSSTLIPQQLLPTNLLESRLNILEDSDGNAVSPLSPMAGNKLKKQYKKRKLSEKDLKKSTSNASSATAKGRRKSQQLKKQQQNNRGMRRSFDSEGGGDDVDATTDEEDENVNMEVTTLDASQQLRSWIDQYEEAVTNHYSPELRARLAGAGKWGGGISNGDLRPSVIGSMTRCNVSLQGNGVKILTASSNLTSNTPIIECKGKLMLAAQYRTANRKSPAGQNDNSSLPINPYVFFYQLLSDSLEICLDGKTYGNDSRFCRRSTNDYNSELRHVIDKGSLHLFIITLKNVEKNQEILLPPDSSCRPQEYSPLPSINADLREISLKTIKPTLTSPTANGMVSPTMSPASVRSSDLDESTPLSSTRNRQSEDNSSPSPQTNEDRKNQKEKRKFPKLVLKSPKKSKALAAKENKLGNKARKVKKGTEAGTDSNLKSNKTVKKQNTTINEDKTSHKKSSDKSVETGHNSTPTSPTKYGSAAKQSPGKLGLPDNSGLIVGVNTINYDASSDLRNKSKSREERKMEMIMKAFEAMERAEQKKKETHGSSADHGASSGGGGGGYQSVRGSTDSERSSATNKRRRSSAKDGGKGNADSNVDASSAEDMANDDTDDGEEEDEITTGAKKKTDKGKTKKSFGRNKNNRKSTTPNTPKRRRSRISSGGSGSGMEDIPISNAKENNLDSSTASAGANTSGNGQNGPFRFPKTKKTLMSDWLQESNEASRSPNPAFGDDDDVSANYLRGSRSPPGIAMHLLRSAIGNNTTTTPLSSNIPSPHSPPVKTGGGNHVCSAKKRWLRQAISEDHGPGDILSPVHHEVAFLMNGSNSPISSGEGPGGPTGNGTFSDYVTPLKKRRLQSYKDEQKFLEDEANASSEENNLPPSLNSVSTTGSNFTSKTATSYNSSYTEDVKVLPNGIKKKLLHNLVLEAVLDRAMEDMLNVRPKNEVKNYNNADSIDFATTSVEEIEVKCEEIDEEVEVEEGTHKLGKMVTKLETMTAEKDEETMQDQTNSLVGDNEINLGESEDSSAAHAALIEKKENDNEIANDSSIMCTSDQFKAATTLLLTPDKVSNTTPFTSSTISSSNIPEPSSVFKSFFKSNVSIEDLEAELEVTRRQREAEQKQLQQLTAKQREEEVERQRQTTTMQQQALEMKHGENSGPLDKYDNETTKVKREEGSSSMPFSGTNKNSCLSVLPSRAIPSTFTSSSLYSPQSSNIATHLNTKLETKVGADLANTEQQPQLKSESNNYATTSEDSKPHIAERPDEKTTKLIDTITNTLHQTSDAKTPTIEELSTTSRINSSKMVYDDKNQVSEAILKQKDRALTYTSSVNTEISTSPAATAEPPKPKEKRKFSLADYKRRRQEQQQQQQQQQHQHQHQQQQQQQQEQQLQQQQEQQLQIQQKQQLQQQLQQKQQLQQQEQQQQQQLSNASTISDQNIPGYVASTSTAPLIGTTKQMSANAELCSSENSLDSYSSVHSSNGGSKSKDIPLMDADKAVDETSSTVVVSIHSIVPEESLIGQTTANCNAVLDDRDQADDDFGAGTPTMDEDQMAPVTTILPSSGGIPDISSLPNVNAPITLNTLPLFEKLEKLEKAQKENKKKALGNVSPPPEPKREDLTERLKKEFGLTVDADDDDTPVSEEDDKGITCNNLNLNENRDDAGDATPEEDSPPPPTSLVGGTGSSLSSIHRHPTMTRLPDQMAQYPTTSTATSSINSTLPQSNPDSSNIPQQHGYPKGGQFNNSNNYGQTTQSGGGGQSSRYSNPSSTHQIQQSRGASYQQHSSGPYSSQTSSYQRHPQPPSRSHPPVSHPGNRMAYPPPLPPASVIANAPHPNKISDSRDVHSTKSSSTINNFKRSNSSKEKEYYSQHSWSTSERDSSRGGDRDRDQRGGGGNSNNRSYYASTTSRGMSDRSSVGSRSNSGGSYTGDKLSSSSSREYNRREYSQIRSASSSSERLGSHGGSGGSLGTDRDLRGGGSEHGSSGTSRTSSSSANVSSSSRTSSSKSSYGRSSYYSN